MGFNDVKVDGLSKDDLNKSIEKFNEIYFGYTGFSLDNHPKGQLELYEIATDNFMKNQFNLFNNYFVNLKWDISDITAQANGKQYIKFDWQRYWITFNNGTKEKSYRICPTSDFQYNPYFELRKDGIRNKIYPKGGTPIDAVVIKQRLDEIEKIIQHNNNIRNKYNFKLSVNKDYENGGNDYTVYDSIEFLLEEISNEFQAI